ncbi:hypothetical protein [Chryseobacterium sp. FH1]|uniref:hypothetical protein n=1 Tax=Chryseobacterium sp. FH1 TaxID=1233951 RepID=UPI0004E40F67|nr:hypothetical protein [Chryseobacterium sp. FH1]KFC19351.1 hypothetical protein IO90_08580 [Chryseobacterium sp. FH1]
MANTRIVKIVFEDGSDYEFKELPKEHFEQKYPGNKHWINFKFNRQYPDFEERIISDLRLDVEEYAIEQYSLIPKRDQKKVDDFDDDEIEAEFINRGLTIEDHHIQNENITNDSFVTRFINVINRGNDAEIENALTMLEKNYRIK